MADSIRQLTRVEQGWRLPIEGMTVTQIAVDYAVPLAFDAQFAVRIGMPFRQFGPDSSVQRLDPEADPSLLAPALTLLRTKAVSGFAFDDGRLELTFQEDHAARVNEAESRLKGDDWKTVSGGSLPEAKYGSRYPDLVMSPGNQQIAVQVGRTTKGGIPVARERRAMDDLRSTGTFDHVFFLRYQP